MKRVVSRARLALVGIVAFATAGCVAGPAPGSQAQPGHASAAASSTGRSSDSTPTVTATASPQPIRADIRACVLIYPAPRCEAMLTAAAEILGVADDDVTAIAIAPDPTPRADGVLETLGGARAIIILAQLDGTIHEVPMCFGIPSGPACMNAPMVGVRSAIGAGYRDVPCTGEPPDGCPKPIPRLDPAAVRAAEPLRIGSRVIPVTALGPQEVRLGTATIPNGVLTIAEGRLADPWPAGVRFSSRELSLEVRSLVAGRPPFMNVYEHGWWPGTEAVEVFLVFDVRHVEPGATIEIRNIVVG